jgi:YidC/Oxa1 family membrane protein insertase
VARQSPEAAANPQTAIMNKLALYVFPLGVTVGGPFLPLAIILYWFANNIWTFGQQHIVFGRIEKEEEAKKQEAIERRSTNAPAPGAKPRKRKPTAEVAEPVSDAVVEDEPASQNGQPATDAAPVTAADSADAKPAAARNRTPSPGARPKKRKR